MYGHSGKERRVGEEATMELVLAYLPYVYDAGVARLGY